MNKCFLAAAVQHFYRRLLESWIAQHWVNFCWRAIHTVTELSSLFRDGFISFILSFTFTCLWLIYTELSSFFSVLGNPFVYFYCYYSPTEILFWDLCCDPAQEMSVNISNGIWSVHNKLHVILHDMGHQVALLPLMALIQWIGGDVILQCMILCLMRMQQCTLGLCRQVPALYWRIEGL